MKIIKKLFKIIASLLLIIVGSPFLITCLLIITLIMLTIIPLFILIIVISILLFLIELLFLFIRDVLHEINFWVYGKRVSKILSKLYSKEVSENESIKLYLKEKELFDLREEKIDKLSIKMICRKEDNEF